MASLLDSMTFDDRLPDAANPNRRDKESAGKTIVQAIGTPSPTCARITKRASVPSPSISAFSMLRFLWLPFVADNQH